MASFQCVGHCRRHLPDEALAKPSRMVLDHEEQPLLTITVDLSMERPLCWHCYADIFSEAGERLSERLLDFGEEWCPDAVQH